ncbi:MAG: ABC transporter permease, partial [Telluria sp.]
MHTLPTSPGLWTLAWRRLKGDRIAMLALAVVALFLTLLVLSGAGLVAADWEDEVAVSYAPPSFVGPQDSGAAASGAARGALANEFDPLADDIRAIQTELDKHAPLDMYGVDDPLAA